MHIGTYIHIHTYIHHRLVPVFTGDLLYANSIFWGWGRHIYGQGRGGEVRKKSPEVLPGGNGLLGMLQDLASIIQSVTMELQHLKKTDFLYINAAWLNVTDQGRIAQSYK